MPNLGLVFGMIDLPILFMSSLPVVNRLKKLIYEGSSELKFIPGRESIKDTMQLIPFA